MILCWLSWRELENRDEVIEDLKQENVSIRIVNFTTMMELINYCEELADKQQEMETRIEKENQGFWEGLLAGFKVLFSQLQWKIKNNI